MDLLSQVIAALRTGRAASYVIHCQAPWGRKYAPVSGAGVHLVLEGSAFLIPPKGSPVPLQTGDVVLLPAGRDHGLADAPTRRLLDLDHRADVAPDRDFVTIGPDGRSANGERSVLLCGTYEFDRARPHPLIGQLPDVVLLPARLGRHDELRDTVGLLAAELDARRPGSDAAVSALLELVFVQALRSWYDAHPETPWSAVLADAPISRALRLMHDQPQRTLTLSALAAEAGLSRAAFARRFKDLVGVSPHAYLTGHRMASAATLLRDTDLPLDTVARRVGYASSYAFAKTFKREQGTAPGRYRSTATRN